MKRKVKKTRFSYNAQNQLIKVEKEGQSFQYAYDAFGETTFLLDGDVLLSEQRNNINITYLKYESNCRLFWRTRCDS